MIEALHIFGKSSDRLDYESQYVGSPHLAQPVSFSYIDWKVTTEYSDSHFPRPYSATSAKKSLTHVFGLSLRSGDIFPRGRNLA